MKSKDLKGKTVVSITEGATLGRVDDVLVDPEALRVAALHVTGHGEAALIPFDQVQSAGGDVVTVPSRAAARPPAEEEAAPLASLDAVTKLKVVDEAGTVLGVVQSLEVDPQSGAILALQTQKATAFGLGRASHTVAASEVTTVGEELIVVQAPAPAAVECDAQPHGRTTLSVVPTGGRPHPAAVPASRAPSPPPAARPTGHSADGSEEQMPRARTR